MLELTRHSFNNIDEGLKYVWKVGYKYIWSDNIFWSKEYSLIVGKFQLDDKVKIAPGIFFKDYKMVSFTSWASNLR
jgi:hypothetical protein